MDDDAPGRRRPAHAHAGSCSATTASVATPPASATRCARSPPPTCAQFFAAHYRSEATTVAVAGDVDHDDIVAKVAAAFADLPDRRRAHRPHAARSVLGESVAARRRLRAGAPRHRRPVVASRRPRPRGARRRQPRLRRRAVEPPVRRDPRAARARLQRLLGDVGLLPTPAPGRCTPGRCPSTPARCTGWCWHELDRLVADGITDDELAIAVGYLTGAYEMGLEDTGARMSRLGGMLATLGKVHTVEEQLARWERGHARRREARASATSTGPRPPIVVCVGPQYS